MTELERRVLSGDTEAQRECTEKGILLPCSFCGGNAIRTSPPVNYSYRVACKVCRANTGGYKTQTEADAAWNTRPAPPWWRCSECANAGEWTNDEANCHVMDGCIVGPNDFCSEFEPKGEI